MAPTQGNNNGAAAAPLGVLNTLLNTLLNTIKDGYADEVRRQVDKPQASLENLSALHYQIRMEPKMTTMGNALHAAVWLRKVGAVRVLLEKGMSIDGATSTGDTALTLHARRVTSNCLSVDREIFEILIDAGANVDHTNAAGRSAIGLVIERFSSAFVELLVNRGNADIKTPDPDDRTPLEQVCLCIYMYLSM